MMKNNRIPFTKLTSEGWIKLFLAAILTFHIITIGLSFINNYLCWNLAFDYCVFYSSGEIINERGFTFIYDLDILKEFQLRNYSQELISNINNSSNEIVAAVILYLPVFLVPFKLFSTINLPYSYFLWAFLNLIGLFVYLKFFIKKTTGYSLDFKMLLMIGLSLPVFINFQLGQVNLWLLVCTGEFIRAMVLGKTLHAGLWLGGWMLKPQLLLLMVPFLLIQRYYKVILGFFISTISILTMSLILIGYEGFISLKNILLHSAGGGGGSDPMAMMNWRMLGLHIETLTSPSVGWAFITIGSILTVAITLFYFRRRVVHTSHQMMVVFLGVFAASSMIAWHAHLHTAMILIPPILYLYKTKYINRKLFLMWVFFPVFIYYLGYILLFLLVLGIPQTTDYFLPNYLSGLTGFAINVSLLVWSVIQNLGDKEENPSFSILSEDEEYR
jgi:hypothetical protein